MFVSWNELEVWAAKNPQKSGPDEKARLGLRAAAGRDPFPGDLVQPFEKAVSGRERGLIEALFG